MEAEIGLLIGIALGGLLYLVWSHERLLRIIKKNCHFLKGGSEE